MKIQGRGSHERRGIALIPTMLILSGLAVFVMALMTTVVSGKKNVVQRADDYQLSSAVESVATLAVEALWSDYIATQGGAAGDIRSFREFLVTEGIPDTYDPDDLAPPAALEGVDMLGIADLPGLGVGDPEFNGVNVASVQLVRRDIDVNATQLFVTVTATSGRGEGLLAQPLDRAVQVVFTIEPADFDGFEYAMLANNINCIFCHTSVDSVDRYYNTDELAEGSFPRVKVGTLESLMIRHHMDGNTGAINDFDSDSLIAGTVYSRGSAVMHDGSNISDWGDLSFKSYAFDETGNIVEGEFGLEPQAFSPAGDPPGTLENLYLQYPDVYTDMVDGTLPLDFPAPIPDDGGINPATGLPAAGDAGNRVVDDFEFAVSAQSADGTIGGGVKNVSAHGDPIGDVTELATAFIAGNAPGSLPPNVDGNVVLMGTAANPLHIEGTVAIDGDLIINGYIEGEGTLIVRGNVYVPSDLRYNDGREYLPGDTEGFPTGPRTFGIAQDGNPNVLGLMAGGNIMIGDFTRPATLQWEDTWEPPAANETISGNPDTGDPAVDEWSFTLAEMSMFNRGEWAKTQPVLPANEAEAALDPSAWTAANPNYVPPDADGNPYIPRYYSHGEDTIVPIFNRGTWFDTGTGTWHSSVEVPIGWDTEYLSYADPSNPSDPFLYGADGSPKAVRSSLSSTENWLPQDLYKIGMNYLQSAGVRPWGDPMAIDGLLYTNNAIFSLVNRATTYYGRLVVNGSLVAADLGMLAPGYPDPTNVTGTLSPLSTYAIGLQLNYDQRVKDRLNVRNPFQVQLKRTLWNPTANLL